jgi:hypothetical protein
MKTPQYFLHAFAFFFAGILACGAEPQIKLAGRKDAVISAESRQTVLNVARLHLSEETSAFAETIKDADSPFVFEQVDDSVLNAKAAEEPTVINYDDASVLRVVSRNFSTQVRGILTRGSTSFLQLRGGSMLKPGTSFPVEIPQAQGQTFTVTVIATNPGGYTLKLGEATQEISVEGSDADTSRATISE